MCSRDIFCPFYSVETQPEGLWTRMWSIWPWSWTPQPQDCEQHIYIVCKSPDCGNLLGQPKGTKA